MLASTKSLNNLESVFKVWFSHIIISFALLFCLMAVMAGLQKTGIFSLLAETLLKRIHGIKGLTLILVMLCFFFSMLITNDVALITFVPFMLQQQTI